MFGEEQLQVTRGDEGLVAGVPSPHSDSLDNRAT